MEKKDLKKSIKESPTLAAQDTKMKDSYYLIDFLNISLLSLFRSPLNITLQNFLRHIKFLDFPEYSS